MSLKPSLKLAVAKGYIWDCAVSFFESCGWVLEDDLTKSRQLWTYEKTQNITLLRVRSWDVPSYVQEGGVDLGIVGKDVMIEQQSELNELLDLGFGGCKLVIASQKQVDMDQLDHYVRVATKYVHSSLQYFKAKGLAIHPIKLAGAIELAPSVGMADMICDLTATGQTLKENGLEIQDTVFESTARLIANPVRFKEHYKRILEIVNAFKAQL